MSLLSWFWWSNPPQFRPAVVAQLNPTAKAKAGNVWSWSQTLKLWCIVTRSGCWSDCFFLELELHHDLYIYMYVYIIYIYLYMHITICMYIHILYVYTIAGKWALVCGFKHLSSIWIDLMITPGRCAFWGVWKHGWLDIVEISGFASKES